MTEILAEKACTPCRGGDVIRGAIMRNPPGPRRCSGKGWRP
jgi:hypothetical protein